MKLILEKDNGTKQEIKQFILISFKDYMFPPTSEMGTIESECISNIPHPYREEILGNHYRWESKLTMKEVKEDE